MPHIRKRRLGELTPEQPALLERQARTAMVGASGKPPLFEPATKIDVTMTARVNRPRSEAGNKWPMQAIFMVRTPPGKMPLIPIAETGYLQEF